MGCLGVLQIDFAAGWRELDGVSQQVIYHPFQFLHIYVDVAFAGHLTEMEFQPFLLCQRREGFMPCMYQQVDINGLRI